MPVPIMRRFSKPAVGVLNVQDLMTDDITTLTFVNITKGNVIQDMFNDPDPGAADDYTMELFKNSISTGRNFFSNAMSPASAGRASVGPIPISAAQYQFGNTQTAGVAAINSIVVKFGGSL